MAYGAHVQSVGKSSPALGDSLAFGSNNTAGNTLVATIWGLTGGTFSFSDSQANSWVEAETGLQDFGGGDVLVVAVWVCVSCAGGANTVTFAATDGGDHYWHILEFEGSSELGPVNNANGGTSPITGGALVVSSDPTLIVMAGATVSNRTFTEGSGYVVHLTTIGPPGRLATESGVFAGAGTYTADMTMTNNGWASASMALSEGGGVVITPLSLSSAVTPVSGLSMVTGKVLESGVTPVSSFTKSWLRQLILSSVVTPVTSIITNYVVGTGLVKGGVHLWRRRRR